jgi:hypothetical protein
LLHKLIGKEAIDGRNILPVKYRDHRFVPAAPEPPYGGSALADGIRSHNTIKPATTGVIRFALTLIRRAKDFARMA